MARGAVKFFNAAKGFGFISPDDGSSDVFVHISAVERSGLSELTDGDLVEFELEQDRRSGKLAAVDLQVVGRAAPSDRQSRPRFDRAPPDRREGGFQPRGAASRGDPVGAGRGVVKWFNSTKGFGFIQPDDGGADVFVHISAVERSGLSGLPDGQAVAYDLEQDRRSGKTAAINLRPLG